MPETVGVVSLGCAKNRVDSEQMLGILSNLGYSITQKPEEAQILIVNTCGFIESAKQESIDALLEMAKFKKSGHCLLLIATGCLVQRYVDDLYQEIPEIDAFIGVSEYPRLPEMIGQAKKKRRPVACEPSLAIFEGPRVLTTPSFSAYVRIGEGCDHCCSYCAIPSIRGPYRSRAYANLLAECCVLSSKGVSEITFIAQDTARYGDDLFSRKRLSDLITDTCAMDSVHWVRVLYCHPDHVGEALLDALANEPKACGYLDMPIQHIDSEVLRAMNRRGGPDAIHALIKKARERNLTFRTTLMVGFPGETDAAFEKLLRFVQEIRFDRMGAFVYSAEEGTKAFDMPDQVPEEVKRERLDRLMRLQAQISLEINRKRAGEVAETLIEREYNGKYIGRTQKEAPEGDGVIWVHSEKLLLPGTYVRVRMTRADRYDMAGEALT